jgi:hypothetical protein
MMSLVEEIEAFLKANEMKPTLFGVLALKDPAFVAQLRTGRDCKLSTAEKVRNFMTKYPPAPVV